jgi:hypothetical protein
MSELTWIAIAFTCAAVGFAAQMFVLNKLRDKGYRYSDLYGLRVYSEYARTAGESGWSRTPLFLIPVALLACLMSFLVAVIHFQ